MDGTLYSGGGGVAKLLRRWRNYNQVAFFGGLLALAGAASLWSLMYFGGQFATLGILSAIYGHESELPREYPFWFAGVCVFLVLLHFVLGEVFPPPSSYDRPILGWHLLPQVLTLPVGLTMAIYQQWRRIVRFEQGLLVQMLEVLREIANRKKIWLEEWDEIPFRDRELSLRALRFLEELGYVRGQVHRPAAYGMTSVNREGQMYYSICEEERGEVERVLGEIVEWIS